MRVLAEFRGVYLPPRLVALPEQEESRSSLARAKVLQDRVSLSRIQAYAATTPLEMR